MKQLFRLFILLFVFGIFVSCKKENNPPTIQSTTASPQIIKTGETTQLTCMATDPDGDQLTYSWSSSNGTFSGGTNSSSVTWEAPDEPGTYTISVIVNDGQNVVNGTVDVEVLQTSKIVGYVYYSGTLIPVLGVTVSIGDVSFTTDESGHFLLQNIAFGNAELKATKLNFDNFSKSITVNETANYVTIEMTSDIYTHNVSGYISDEDGKKLSGVIVSILNPDGSVSNLLTTSDAGGYYQLPSVPQGSRTIKLEKEGYSVLQADIFISNSDYPYNATLESYKIYGSISDFNGNLLSGVSVSILQTNGNTTNYTATTDNIGYYELKNVPPGNWIIVFEKSGFASHRSDISVSNVDVNFEYNTRLFHVITDSRDDKTYKTVKIGDQTWMAENLAYLPAVHPPSSGSSTEPRYYVYGYQGSDVAEVKQHANYTTYWVLYNWPAALTACPSGWHLPTDNEWKQLEMAVGISQSEVDDPGWRGTNEGTKLKATSGWNYNGNGSDDFGFSAIPDGYRNVHGYFVSFGNHGNWWSYTEESIQFAWSRNLRYGSTGVYRNYTSKENGFSVRCVRD